MDGDYGRTLPLRLEYCDTVVFLDYPRWQCVLGVLKRVLTNHGRTRPDMAPGCRERFDWTFLTWVWNWRKNKRQNLVDALAAAEGVRVIVLKNRKEGRKFLEHIQIPRA
jgi:adenylate kinase family enzyme